MSAVTKKPLIKRIRYKLETILVYIIFYFFKIMPLNIASAVGGFIAQTIGPYLKSSKTALKNMSLAFPEKTEEEKEQILKAMWNNIGRTAAEYPHLNEIFNNVEEILGKQYLEEARNLDDAKIFFTAHIANWEVCPVCTSENGIDLHAIYRDPNNPGVRKLLKNARGAGAKGLIPKSSKGAKKMLSVLKNKGTLGILMDQKLNEGVAIPFFGHDAMTAPAIATFALKFKCPIYPMRVERIKGTKFRSTTYPSISIDENSTIESILTEINKYMEEWIKDRPEQWLWIHKRWPNKHYKD